MKNYEWEDYEMSKSLMPCKLSKFKFLLREKRSVAPTPFVAKNSCLLKRSIALLRSFLKGTNK